MDWPQSASDAIYGHRFSGDEPDVDQISDVVVEDMFGALDVDDEEFEGLFKAIGKGAAAVGKGIGKGARAVSKGLTVAGKGVGKGAKFVAVGPRGKGGIVGVARGAGRGTAAVVAAGSGRREARRDRRSTRSDRRGSVGGAGLLSGRGERRERRGERRAGRREGHSDQRERSDGSWSTFHAQPAGQYITVDGTPDQVLRYMGDIREKFSRGDATTASRMAERLIALIVTRGDDDSMWGDTVIRQVRPFVLT